MTQKINDGGPAHPSAHSLLKGMTLRDYFAGQALQGILAGFWANPDLGNLSPETAALQAVVNADAMIAALGDGQ